MKGPINIEFFHLIFVLIPAFMVVGIQYLWKQNYKKSLISLARMLGQLLLVGYLLTAIFMNQKVWIFLVIIAVMLVVASWIIYRTIEINNKHYFYSALISLAVVSLSMLFFILFWVIKLDSPFKHPSYVIPLAGMIIANTMNTLSLAFERFVKEKGDGKTYELARSEAFRLSLIPSINALLAVGIVSLPGMMTGQILSGVDPLIACRYQIMIMATIFGSGGLAAAFFLLLLKKDYYFSEKAD